MEVDRTLTRLGCARSSVKGAAIIVRERGRVFAPIGSVLMHVTVQRGQDGYVKTFNLPIFTCGIGGAETVGRYQWLINSFKDLEIQKHPVFSSLRCRYAIIEQTVL